VSRRSLDRRATEFERLRPYLLRVAYAHTGSVSEADDLVQEAWLRLQRSSSVEIRDLRAWLTTTVSRLALDALTSVRARRETYVGAWLPEPIVQTLDPGQDPAERLTLDESVSMALLVVLESLTRAERCAFLLHDVFGYPFAEVAAIVGRSPQAARQLATRARRAVEAGRPRQPADPEQQRRVVEAFLNAAAGGDVAGLLAAARPRCSVPQRRRRHRPRHPQANHGCRSRGADADQDGLALRRRVQRPDRQRQRVSGALDRTATTAQRGRIHHR
jgi:RNA polymerase sigma-70 factor (ECF subfamily)